MGVAVERLNNLMERVGMYWIAQARHGAAAAHRKGADA